MDLGSRNGTFVNDQRVIMPVTLESGSRIRIADYESAFDQDSGQEEGEHVDATVAALSSDGSHAILSVAILVCDIRGFTPMAEKLGEQKIAHLLGNWFRDTGNIVHSAGGIIDKYIGDAVLAYWPARDQEGTESAICLDSSLAILQLASNQTSRKPPQPFPL